MKQNYFQTPARLCESYTGLLLVLALVALTGCATTPSAGVFESSSAVQLRSFQSRVFDTDDRQATLRSVMATMQDLGFVIDQADPVIGSVSGTRQEGYQIKMTVTVRPREADQVLVRANAAVDRQALEDPLAYQSFFAALEKSMFLTAHQVD